MSFRSIVVPGLGLIVLASVYNPTIGADGSIKRDDKALLKYVIDGMLHQRNIVRTGEVEVAESYKVNTSIRRQCKLRIAFDLDSDALRFDRNDILGHIEALYIRKPDVAILQVLQNGSSDGTITKMRPDATPPISVMPFDFRCIGLTDRKGLERNVSFSDVTNYFNSFSGSCWETKKNVFTLELKSEKNSRIKLVVDESKGMAPVLFESGPATSDLPAVRVSTEWSERTPGIWVPVHADIRSLDLVRRHATYDLDWKSVNKPVSTKLFEMGDFRPEHGTLVIDRRLGKPVIETIFGGVPSKIGNQITKRRFTLPLIIANVVVVVLLIVAIYMRRRFFQKNY